MAAKIAPTKFNAIPEEALVEDKGADIFILSAVEYLALSISMIEPTTNAGTGIKARAVAWLNRGRLADLVPPVEAKLSRSRYGRNASQSVSILLAGTMGVSSS